MNATHIRHVGLYSTDAAAHARFYSDMWGLARVAEREGVHYLRGKSKEHHVLGLYPGDAPGLHHVAFGMADRAGIDAAAEALAVEGVPIVAEPGFLDEEGGGYGLRFLDPEKRCVELSTGVAIHDNGWKGGPVEPISVCHVVLNTARFEEIVDFWVAVLGFRVSDWSEDQMVFLRCNTKHHVVSFNRSTHASVNHVAYLMAGVDDLMRGVGTMRRHGREPDWGPGRHGPGNNVFCYYRDPFGYVTEYTSDIDTIADDTGHVPRVWERRPDLMDRWGTAGPPSADIRAAMAGRPDPGWVSDADRRKDDGADEPD